MSKSDARRRSYLADQMTMGERVEALEGRVNVTEALKAFDESVATGIQRQIHELEKRLEHFENDDNQYFHDELRSLGRRVADLESSGTTRGPVRYLDPAGNIVDKGDSRRAPSPTECGRIVVDAGEWDRLQRIREAAQRVRDFSERFTDADGPLPTKNDMCWIHIEIVAEDVR